MAVLGQCINVMHTNCIIICNIKREIILFTLFLFFLLMISRRVNKIISLLILQNKVLVMNSFCNTYLYNYTAIIDEIILDINTFLKKSHYKVKFKDEYNLEKITNFDFFRYSIKYKKIL